MKLLILTQKVDIKDPILGFFHGWIKEFSQNVEKLTVICLEKGQFDLPENVEVLSLGKENGVSRLKYVYNFYKYIWQKRANYSHVFVHMNPEYIVLGGLFWRFWNKNIGLWYTHRESNMKLWISELLSDSIFTASEKSFTLKSSKLHVLGHGIDLERFSDIKKIKSDTFNIFHIGRITEIKNLKTLLETTIILKNTLKKKFKIILIGSPITRKDFEYKKELERIIKENELNEVIEFRGHIPNNRIQECYAEADLIINLTPTGGLDKVVLEAVAAGVIPLSSNDGFLPYFDEFSHLLHFKFRQADDLASKIISIVNHTNNDIIKNLLLKIIKEKADLKNLIKNILNNLRQSDNNLIILRYFRTIKYIISGGTAAAVNLILLFLLTEFLNIWYLSSAVLAFTIAFIVSFVMQKLWTFEDGDMDSINRQLSLYLFIALLNLTINTGLLYFLVDTMKVHYLLGQIITSGSVAMYSFFIYKHFIFNKTF